MPTSIAEKLDSPQVRQFSVFLQNKVGALLEVPHVAERAAVDAAHVRVQRPLEGHALDAVQRAAAGLFPVLRAHASIIGTYVRLCSQLALR